MKTVRIFSHISFKLIFNVTSPETQIKWFHLKLTITSSKTHFSPLSLVNSRNLDIRNSSVQLQTVFSITGKFEKAAEMLSWFTSSP